MNGHFLRPDLVVIFENLEYLRRVREIFLSLRNNIVVVNAERDLEEVKKDVLDIVLKHLESSK